MGCACLHNRLNFFGGGNNEINDIEEEPDNNSNNNDNIENQKSNSVNENENKNNSELKQKYVIMVGDQPKFNKSVLGYDSSSNVLNRAKSSPPAQKENDETNLHQKPKGNNLIANEEFQEFCTTHNSLNDSVEIEIRPGTTCENKTIYHGEWDIKNNKRHGRGIQIWPDGSKYLGYWKNDQPWKGKLIHPDGDIYDGEWEGGKPNGTGCYTHLDGTKYVGEWKNDRQEGNGEETWPDGSMYKGQYKEGKKQSIKTKKILLKEIKKKNQLMIIQKVSFQTTLKQ